MGSHTVAPDHEAPADAAVTEAMDALRRIVRVLRLSAGTVEREVGLSGAQLFVLQQVGSCAGSSINELAARTHTHQSSVSTVVARLQERGLVIRTPSSSDRRRVEVSVTTAGAELLGNAPDVAQTRLLHGLREMADPDRDALVQGLAAWVRAIGADLDPAELFFEAETPAPRGRP